MTNNSKSKLFYVHKHNDYVIIRAKKTLDSERRKQKVTTVSVNHLRRQSVDRNDVVLGSLEVCLSELGFERRNPTVYVAPRGFQSFDFAEDLGCVSTVVLHGRAERECFR